MHQRLLGRCAALLAVVLAASAAPRLASADEAPAKPPAASPVIDRFHAVLIDVMKNAPALDATYDFPAMAQRSLSTHWAELTPEQHERFIDVFRAMTLRTYATRFDGYDGERFET